MRIAILTLNRGRGSGAVARHEAASLAAAGHHTTLLHAGEMIPVPGVESRSVALHSAVLPVHEYLPATTRRQRAVPTMPIGMARRYIADYVAALDSLHDVDMILAHHATITAVAARAVARSRGIPYAVFAHGTGIEPRHHGGFADALWRDVQQAIVDADDVLVTTPYVRDTLVLPLVGRPVTDFTLIPCGVDTAPISLQERARVAAKYHLPNRYVVCPGALTEAKGPLNVARASVQFADVAPVVYLGDGDMRSEIAATSGEGCRLLGYVPEEDKDPLIAQADLLVAAPNKREHFGIIYAEAMAYGVPPVAYRGGGVPDVVGPEAGILVERDPAALGRAVRLLLEDAPRRSTMARLGRRRATELFDKEAVATRFVAWAEKTATGTRGVVVG